ncbi:heavy metal translocating P-type ATPase [Jiulongibacter sp. NS-SX5]|uniref:heavy metal translocating P-type ATPase n=1 Tax=Jiulongibacter sp. NS-SX5 TaxID=3463854 RepID=UPI004059D35A
MAEVLEEIKCHHCGEDCSSEDLIIDELHFCCIGCKTVYELLQENDLCGYYDLEQHAGVSLKSKDHQGKFDYLKNPTIEDSILDFKSEKLNKVTLFLPAVHCSSCVWLLENFNKIRSGVLHSRLNFLKKELSLTYDPRVVNMKVIVELLATLGYEPLISLENTVANENKKQKRSNRLLRQIAVVGFCTGNIMLLSFPEYFKLDLQNEVDAQYQKFFLYLNVLLAMPVYFYGAADYLKGAWISLKEVWKRNTTTLSVDIPIALGVTALFIRSLYETLINGGGAYWDSMAGLVFLLLLGKWVQKKTFDYLSFERNYKSYFPLAVEVRNGDSFDYKNVDDLQKGDIIRIHNNELIPADSELVSGQAFLDYSFVTGESEPISVRNDEVIYAGGRQKGQNIELRVTKEVSKSYLTQLWNQTNFKEEKEVATTKLADNFSKYFTYITLGISFLTAIYWSIVNPEMAWPAFTAVLMVACPCALTLSMPFTMGTVMGIFGKNKFYVKNQDVIQKLTEVKHIVFDKTGTLTKNNDYRELSFIGEALDLQDQIILKSLAGVSTHPVSKLVNVYFQNVDSVQLTHFEEVEGSGLIGTFNKIEYRIGNADFLEIPDNIRAKDARVYLKKGSAVLGYFKTKPVFREGFEKVIHQLNSFFSLHLISGDKSTDKDYLQNYLSEENLHFEQKPEQKLAFIKDLQKTQEPVLMIGDGLNDAGALRQSDLGIALSENTQAFTPASDAILDASKFADLSKFIAFSKKSVNIVKLSFMLSLVYNFICISWAVSGTLSPVVAAIFMPLSSISVVLFAVIITYFSARKAKLIV